MAEHRHVLVTSSLPEAKGVLMGRYINNGTVDAEGFAGMMAEGRPNMDVPAAKLMLGCFGTCARNCLSGNATRIDLEDFTLEKAIDGSLPSLDSPLGDENRKYVAVRLGESLRNCLAKEKSTCVSATEAGIRLETVADAERIHESRRAIIGTRQFVLIGGGLSVNGEGESVTVVSNVDGTSVRAVYDSDDGTGQRIIMHLPTALPEGSAKVIMATRGFNADDSETVIELDPFKVTILAGEAPTPTGDEPHITSGHSSGYGDAGMIDPNADFIMEGSNLAGASVKVDWTDEGGNERTQNIPAGEVEAEDESITLQQGDWLEACTTVDGAVITFTVTTSHGSTTYQATVRA